MTTFDPATAPLSAFPPRGNCFSGGCATRAVLSHIASRWAALILAALRQSGTLRFSELRDRIEGVSERMLAKTLRELERDGVIARRSLGTVPPHVEYSLTALGIGVADHVDALVAWIETHVRELVGAQRQHDAAS